MESLKETYKYLDLYGSEVFIQMLKQSFKDAAIRNKTIPNGGSPTVKSEFINPKLIVEKAIFHKNNEVTVKTNHGYLRFF